MKFYSLYERLKKDYREPFDAYCKKYPTLGRSLTAELKKSEFVTNMNYGDVIGLGSVTGFYGSPFDLFIDYDIYEANMEKLQKV